MVGMVPRMIGTLLGAGELTAGEIAAARIAAGITTDDLKAGYAIRKLLEEGGQHQEVEPEHEDIVIPVMSTAITAIGWKKGNIITVHFKRGGHLLYTYDGTYELFQAFVLSPSKGKFFNEHFK
jgi:KTSC domain